MKDNLGTELAVGDYIAFGTKGARYGCRMHFGRILAIRESSMTVNAVKPYGRPPAPNSGYKSVLQDGAYTYRMPSGSIDPVIIEALTEKS